MKAIDNKVCMTRAELDDIIASKRFYVSEHTPYYMNCVEATYKHISIGFYNWLDNMECYTSGGDNELWENQILIKDDTHLQLILNAMDALMALGNYDKTTREK
jgi:hypothetical protein